MPKLLTSTEIIRVLEMHGFRMYSKRGGHAKYKKDSFSVIVPYSKKEIPIGTFLSIAKQSGLEQSVFEK